MKKLWLIIPALAILIAFSGYTFAQQLAMPMGRGFGGYGMSGQGMWGGGMHGQTGGMMGPMMMETGETFACPGSGTGTQTALTVTKDSVTEMVKRLLAIRGNPNLKLGEVRETETDFIADIVTKDNSLVVKIVVDKKTGWTRRTY